MIPNEWIDNASKQIQSYIIDTPLTYDPELDIFLKWESRQITGSFKLRGALNKILSLHGWELDRGLVTASAGNHGLGVAWAAAQVGAKATIFASDHAAPVKLNAIKKLGAKIVLVPGGYTDAELAAIQFARDHNRIWISPYNDGTVIAGQATVGLEVLRHPDTTKAAAWVVPVGGGGLISGIGAVLAKLPTRPRLIGVQSEASPYFHAMLHQGNLEGVTEVDSLADGLAGQMEIDSITIPLVRHLVDDIRLVSEEEIAGAVAYAFNHYGETIEGSAAVGLAAVLNGIVKEMPAVVIISGGNIEPDLLKNLLDMSSNQPHSPEISR